MTDAEMAEKVRAWERTLLAWCDLVRVQYVEPFVARMARVAESPEWQAAWAHYLATNAELRKRRKRRGDHYRKG